MSVYVCEMWGLGPDCVVVVMQCLDPVSLVRVAGVSRLLREVVAGNGDALWRRFVDDRRVRPSLPVFIAQPLTRRPEFMFVKRGDTGRIFDDLGLDDCKRRWVKESIEHGDNPNLVRLLLSGCLSVWAVKHATASQLRSLDYIFLDQDDIVVDVIDLHRRQRRILDDILRLLDASYSAAMLALVLRTIGIAGVRHLLLEGVISFVDLVHAKLSTGHSGYRGGLVNLRSARLCQLVSAGRATLQQIARLSIWTAMRLRSDFLWQYIMRGDIDLETASRLPLAITNALESPRLYDVVSTGHVRLSRVLTLPAWAIYQTNLVLLWDAYLLNADAITSLECDMDKQSRLRDPAVFDAIKRRRVTAQHALAVPPMDSRAVPAVCAE